MARGKKAAKELTAEEKLEQALVPVDEQPYPVPENWCWTYIGNGFNVTSSKRVHKKDWVNAGIPFYRTRELVKLSEYGHIDNELFISKELYEKLVGDFGRPQIGDILISGVGTIGVPFIIKDNALFYFKDGNVIWFQNKGICLPEFVFYLYKSSFMLNQIHDMSAGTTVDTYTIVNATKTIFPLPPFAEQQRIVNRIESIFAKLDEAKEKARAVVDGFELRKSAILHKAFTGELTEKWRQEHGVAKASYKQTNLGSIIQLLSGQDFKPEQYNSSEDGMPYITGASNFDGSHVIINRWTPVPSIIAKYDDVLLVCKGAGYGKTIIADFNEAHIARQIMALRVKEGLLNKFVFYFLQFEYEYLRNNGQGLIPGISRKVVLEMPINLPSTEEQLAIISLVERIIEKEQQAKEAAESVLDQIDTMKKAVLARAFRGELDTNDPEDESAVELLKYIINKC